MRTFNDIVPPSRRKELNNPTNRKPAGAGQLPPSEPQHFPYTLLIVVALVIVVSIGALYYFSTARVEVTPNTVSAAVQSPFRAAKDTDLPFQIITAQKIASQSIKGTGTKTVSAFASGSITIYNTRPQAQQLVTNTRFATTAGLIFRIHSAVSIPGGTSDKPGNLTIKVFADQAGSTYNVGPTSFTIPGFAGTPLASAVYARSTSAMTGGASGSVAVVDPTLEEQAKNALLTALAPDLAISIKAQIPSGYTLLDGAATTTYEELPPSPSTTAGMVDVKEQGTVTAVVFPTDVLSKAVASSISGLGYQGEPVMLSPTSSLLLAPENGFPDSSATSFSFTLTGTASLTYTVDATRIAAAVSGKSRDAALVALHNYPEVKSAVLILRPFWRQTFPQDPATISVVMAKASY